MYQATLDGTKTVEVGRSHQRDGHVSTGCVNRGFTTDVSDNGGAPRQAPVSDVTTEAMKADQWQTKSLLERLKTHCCMPNSGVDGGSTAVITTVRSWFPFIGILSAYDVRSDLLSDVMAGLIVGIMHIPQGKYVCRLVYIVH